MNKDVILFITRHDPSGHSGGSYATRAYLESICELYKDQVVLFVNDEFDDTILINKPLSIIKSKRRGYFKAVVEALTGKFDRHTYNVNQWLNANTNITVKFVVCDGSFVGGYYSPIFKRASIPVVTIYHNYEVEFRKDNKSLESLYGLNIYWVKKLEKTSYNNSTLNLFITQSDLNIFCDNYGERQNNFVLGCYEFPKNSIKIPKSIDNDNMDLGDNIKLVISGSLNTVQSVDSIFWFLSSIYSLVADKEIELTLSGRKPSKEFKSKALEYKNVKIIENPINMLDVLKDNHIYICPVNIGGGIKLRIMDALSLGLPSIIHTKSVRGYESFVKDGYMFEFHDLYSFEKSLELCKSKITNKKFSRINLIDKYNDIFSFNSGTARFHKCLSKLNINVY